MRKSSDWCKLILIYKSTAEWVKTQVWTTPVCLSVSLIHLFLSQCCATVTRLRPSDIITEACLTSPVAPSDWLTSLFSSDVISDPISSAASLFPVTSSRTPASLPVTFTSFSPSVTSPVTPVSLSAVADAETPALWLAEKLCSAAWWLVD